MINPFKEVNWHPGPAERRAFAKSLIIGFPCVALMFLLVGYLRGRGWNVPLSLKIGGGGVAAGLLFYAVPAIAKPFYVVWYALACGIGLVVGNVLLALVYYALFTPIGLGMRACGRRALDKSVNHKTSSYWQAAEPPADPKRYYRQF